MKRIKTWISVITMFFCCSCTQQQLDVEPLLVEHQDVESLLIEHLVLAETVNEVFDSSYIGEVEGITYDYIYRMMQEIWDRFPEMQNIIKLINWKLEGGIHFKYTPDQGGVAYYDMSTMTINIHTLRVFTYLELAEELIHMYQHLITYWNDTSDVLFNARANVEFEAKVYLSILELRYADRNGTKLVRVLPENFDIDIITFNHPVGFRQNIDSFNWLAHDWYQSDVDYYNETFSWDFQPQMLLGLL